MELNKSSSSHYLCELMCIGNGSSSLCLGSVQSKPMPVSFAPGGNHSPNPKEALDIRNTYKNCLVFFSEPCVDSDVFDQPLIFESILAPLYGCPCSSLTG